ncbi:MAG: hypothetical protein M3N98_01170 [Actinomycetota bacterium]|nr:hypothetical protein [Actinomycetota bacterium]
MTGGDDGGVVPQRWKFDVLEHHVVAIIDSMDRYQAGCELCQPAKAAGVFDRFGLGDDDDREEELLDEAIVRHPAAGPPDDGGVLVVPLPPEGPRWGPGGDSCA